MRLEEQRESVRSLLRDVTPANLADEDEGQTEELEGAVVTGWVLVCERMDVTGDKWLTVIDGDAGDRKLTPWQHKGMLFEALYAMGD